MQRNRFLSDILSTLFDRRNATIKAYDKRDIYQLCHALLSEEGDVSGQTLAAAILNRYCVLSDDDKLEFFNFLNESFDIDADSLADLAKCYSETPSSENFKKLTAIAEPKRQELFRRLNQPAGATADLVAMRTDLLDLLPQNPDLMRTDLDLVHLLRSWFNRGFLVLKQINWDTPARILDKIVAYEAVHEIDDLDDLRRRLHPEDRSCFAFFHPAMPDEPLIFVEVALTADIPGSIDALLSEDRIPSTAEDAKVAVFYSISNCQRGLAKISFGNLLIKQVVAELKITHPQLTHFVTLSPIPGLTRWVKTQIADEAHGDVAQAMLDGDAVPEDIRALAARYLVLAKTKTGKPVDPVARFHLGNGATIHNIHAGADSSPNGLAQSGGAMVNYLYDLSRTERNHEDFALNAVVAASRSVTALSTAQFATKPKEVSS